MSWKDYITPELLAGLTGGIAGGLGDYLLLQNPKKRSVLRGLGVGLGTGAATAAITSLYSADKGDAEAKARKAAEAEAYSKHVQEIRDSQFRNYERANRIRKREVEGSGLGGAVSVGPIGGMVGYKLSKPTLKGKLIGSGVGSVVGTIAGATLGRKFTELLYPEIPIPPGYKPVSPQEK